MPELNPTQCVVCRSPLQRVTEQRSVAQPEVLFGEEGYGHQWNTKTVLLQIYCPNCQILYRVANPDG